MKKIKSLNEFNESLYNDLQNAIYDSLEEEYEGELIALNKFIISKIKENLDANIQEYLNIINLKDKMIESLNDKIDDLMDEENDRISMYIDQINELKEEIESLNERIYY